LLTEKTQLKTRDGEGGTPSIGKKKLTVKPEIQNEKPHEGETGKNAIGASRERNGRGEGAS